MFTYPRLQSWEAKWSLDLGWWFHTYRAQCLAFSRHLVNTIGWWCIYPAVGFQHSLYQRPNSWHWKQKQKFSKEAKKKKKHVWNVSMEVTFSCMEEGEVKMRKWDGQRSGVEMLMIETENRGDSLAGQEGVEGGQVLTTDRPWTCIRDSRGLKPDKGYDGSGMLRN